MRFRQHLYRAFKVNPFKVFCKIIKTDSGKIAYKRTKYVLKITLSVYIPIIILCTILIARQSYVGCLLLPLIILSAFPFAKYVLIPLSEKKRDSIVSSVKKELF